MKLGAIGIGSYDKATLICKKKWHKGLGDHVNDTRV